jgi:hypothetical protein
MRTDLIGTSLVFVVALVGIVAAASCGGDACQELADVVIACPDYVDPAGVSSSTGTAGAPRACDDAHIAAAQCLLDSGLDLCEVQFHPDELSPADAKKRDACTQP